MRCEDCPVDGRPKIIIERSGLRRSLQTSAIVRSVKGHIGGSLIDISELGCKLSLFDASVKPGHKITIKLPNLELWVGYVRWANESVVGVVFERPMHSAVVDHLSRSNPSFEVS